MRVTAQFWSLVYFAGFLVTSAAWADRAERTLWLVRPLYPGQEQVVTKTEQAIDKLITPALRGQEVIGLKELTSTLRGRKVEDIPCLTGESRCADPIDPFVSSLGYDRVVLIQGGQDEAGFKFRTVSYTPANGAVNSSNAAAPTLEKALLGALVKVVPLASTLEVKSDPPGATVYIDDVKVGQAPLTTQVLPGERTLRLDLKLHQPLEESLVVPFKGSPKFERYLEKVAARITVNAQPAGASVYLDGELVGKDRIDRGIKPGPHTLRITLDGFRAYEQQLQVKPDETLVLDKTLDSISGPVSVGNATTGVVVGQVAAVPQAPAVPLTETEKVYEERQSYFHVGFEMATFLGNNLTGARFGPGASARLATMEGSDRSLIGLTAEYGTFGRYFGVTVFGASLLVNPSAWTMGIGRNPGDPAYELNDLNENGIFDQVSVAGTRVEDPPTLRIPARVRLVRIRLLHPQFRLAVWRLMFSLQVGAEFQTGWIFEPAGQEYYIGPTPGFIPFDLLIASRLNVRFFLYEGLFVTAAFNFSASVFGVKADISDEKDSMGNVRVKGLGTGIVSSSHSLGFNVGFGYAF